MASSSKVAPMLAQNQQAEVVNALKNLPQSMIDLLSKSKTFKNRRVFIKSSEKKTGGWCKPSMYEIFWGKGRKYEESNLNTLRHELMHMWEGDQYNITYKIPDIATRSDILRMKTPSVAVENKVNEILNKTDYGLHRAEANKILAHYDLTVEELEKFVNFDKSDTFDLKPRGAFAFALYLSQGDLTNAMKSLYQTQMLGFDGQMKWVNSINHNELVYNCFSDFVGSLTQNKVLGRKHGGSGHTNAYYKQRSQLKSKNCELIAQYGAIVGCKEGAISRKILKAFAPYTVNAIETIMKTQTYFNHEGNDVNYI